MRYRGGKSKREKECKREQSERKGREARDKEKREDGRKTNL